MYKPLTDDEIANGKGGYHNRLRLEEQARRANRCIQSMHDYFNSVATRQDVEKAMREYRGEGGET